MAVDITVTLADTQAARLQAIAEVEQPGATPAQIRDWAAKIMRSELRRRVIEIRRRQLADEQREQVVPILESTASTAQADLAALDDDWPEEP